MFFLEVLELIVMVVIVLLAVTQIIIPTILDRPIFPLFRRKNKEAAQAIVKLHGELDLVSKEEEIENLQKQISGRRTRKSKPKESK